MQIILQKKNSSNRPFFYSLDDRQRSLFHRYTLTLRWGHAITGGSVKQLYFDSQSEQDRAIQTILKKKLLRYDVIYSYFRDQKSPKQSSSPHQRHIGVLDHTG
jgi:predicted DNA-binding WGR domain protein